MAAHAKAAEAKLQGQNSLSDRWKDERHERVTLERELDVLETEFREKNKLHDSLFIRLTCEEYRACLHVMALWWCVNSPKPLCFYSPPLSFSGTGWALSIVRQLSAIDMTGQQSPTYGITRFGS